MKMHDASFSRSSTGGVYIIATRADGSGNTLVPRAAGSPQRGLGGLPRAVPPGPGEGSVMYVACRLNATTVLRPPGRGRTAGRALLPWRLTSPQAG